MDSRYQRLVAAVERAINDADPIGLLELGAPLDEYAPEIGTILPRLGNVQGAFPVRTELRGADQGREMLIRVGQEMTFVSPGPTPPTHRP